MIASVGMAGKPLTIEGGVRRFIWVVRVKKCFL